jgi:hypothetical protein
MHEYPYVIYTKKKKKKKPDAQPEGLTENGKPVKHHSRGYTSMEDFDK